MAVIATGKTNGLSQRRDVSFQTNRDLIDKEYPEKAVPGTEAIHLPEYWLEPPFASGKNRDVSWEKKSSQVKKEIVFCSR